MDLAASASVVTLKLRPLRSDIQQRLLFFLVLQQQGYKQSIPGAVNGDQPALTFMCPLGAMVLEPEGALSLLAC